MTKWIVMGSLLLSGCGNLEGPFYVQPESGPRARVRFVADHDSVSAAWTLDPDCKISPHKIALLGKHLLVGNDERHRIGIPLGDKYEQRVMTETHVPANKTFAMVMYMTGAATVAPGATLSTYCGVRFSFEPLENRDYEAVLLKGPKSCEVNLNRIDLANEGGYVKVKEDSLRRLPEYDCKSKK